MRTRNTLLFLAILVTAASGSAVAGVKEELVRLQSDVLALQNQIRVMEKSFNDQVQGLGSLIAQLNDQVGKSGLLLNRLATSMDERAAGGRSDNQAIIQEIRALAGKIDDTATRVSALAQQVSELKVQSKPITTRSYQSGAPGTIALSADNVFNEAFGDLVQGNFDLAIEGFGSFVRNFPTNEKADDAQYYIGEALYSSNKLQEAVTAFTRVLNEYPEADKVASAYFKRAKAELAMQETDNAVADFKTVVEKYPAAAEAPLAKAELDRLGVELTKPAATKAAPKRRKP